MPGTEERPTIAPIQKLHREFSCEGCGSPKIRRAHRVGLKDSLWSLVGRFPYHCHNCQYRSILPAKSLPEKTPSTPLNPGSQIRQERKRSEQRRIQRLILLLAICVVIFALFAHFFILQVPAVPGE